MINVRSVTGQLTKVGVKSQIAVMPSQLAAGAVPDTALHLSQAHLDSAGADGLPGDQSGQQQVAGRAARLRPAPDAVLPHAPTPPDMWCLA